MSKKVDGIFREHNEENEIFEFIAGVDVSCLDRQSRIKLQGAFDKEYWRGYDEAKEEMNEGKKPSIFRKILK